MQKKSTATVIVVDDDASIRRALRAQLAILGFRVTIFQSAEELLAGDFPTDDACLLLDVYMPAVGGIDLCQSLRSSGRCLPTILMSAHDDEATRQIMRDAKPIACLFKPFAEKQLLLAIRKALRSRSHLRG